MQPGDRADGASGLFRARAVKMAHRLPAPKILQHQDTAIAAGFIITIQQCRRPHRGLGRDQPVKVVFLSVKAQAFSQTPVPGKRAGQFDDDGCRSAGTLLSRRFRLVIPELAAHDRAHEADAAANLLPSDL